MDVTAPVDAAVPLPMPSRSMLGVGPARAADGFVAEGSIGAWLAGRDCWNGAGEGEA